MNKKRLLTVMGGNGLQRLSLDFSTLSDGSVPYLSGDTWAISSGKAIVTPTETPIAMLNSSFEVGDPPTYWAAMNSGVLSSQSDERTGGSGSKSIQIARNGNNFPGATQAIATTSDYQFIKVKFWHKLIDASKSLISSNAGLRWLQTFHYMSETDWTYKIKTSPIGTPGNKAINIGAYAAGADGTSCRFDDISCVGITGLTAGIKFNNRLYTIKIDANIPIGEGSGVFCCGDKASDPDNYIFCVVYRYEDVTTPRGIIEVWKVINKIGTRVLSEAITYTSDGQKTVELRRTGLTTFQAWFEDVQVGADITIDDASLIYNKYVGMISTGGVDNSIDAFFLD